MANFLAKTGFFGDITCLGMISGVMESRPMARVQPEMVLVDSSTL